MDHINTLSGGGNSLFYPTLLVVFRFLILLIPYSKIIPHKYYSMWFSQSLKKMDPCLYSSVSTRANSSRVKKPRDIANLGQSWIVSHRWFKALCITLLLSWFSGQKCFLIQYFEYILWWCLS